MALKQHTYFDIIEISELLAKEYDWPSVGESGSFISTLAEATDYPGQDTLAWIEMPDEIDDEFEEDYGEKYVRIVKQLQQLIEDGHLPKQDTYQILVWW